MKPMKIDKEMEARAKRLALEQFEHMDLTEYSRQEIANDVTDLMVWFAQQELKLAND